ncbi:MAG: hypothetical protein ACN4GZ_15855 [Acidimicrobiales bacterium]
MALVLLLGACTDSDRSLEVIGTDGDGSTPTTASDPHDGDSPVDGSIENWDDYSEDVLEPGLSQREFVCADGISFHYDPYDDSRSTGSMVLTLGDGSELVAGGGWAELEAEFVDMALLEFEGRTALRVVDQATGVEQACPETGSQGSLPKGAGPARIDSCAVSPPWGVMGGQQVTYLGERGDEGVVEVHRNGALLNTMLVGVTWEDVLKIRQLETSNEKPDEVPQIVFGAPGEIFYSDFGSPAGELSYALVVRDSEGVELQRIECGSVVVPSLESVTCSLDLLDGFPRLTISGGAFPQEVRRNGEPIEYSLEVRGLVDANATVGVELQYEVTVAAPILGAPSQVVQCGSITAQEVALEDRIRSLAEQISPAHWYGEVTPICDDCNPTPLLLGWNLTKVYRWEDGTFTPIEETTAPWFTSPGAVPQLLLDSIEAGRDVQAEFDGREISQWSFDGEGASYRCLDGDTAPIEIRTPYHQQILDACQNDP